MGPNIVQIWYQIWYQYVPGCAAAHPTGDRGSSAAVQGCIRGSLLQECRCAGVQVCIRESFAGVQVCTRFRMAWMSSCRNPSGSQPEKLGALSQMTMEEMTMVGSDW